MHQPLQGVLRVVSKDGAQAALLCVGNGAFFEKRTVERFLRIMREAKVEQGFLVAAGSFTIPAQRLAKERRITLIGREQLVELVSAGAAGEYITKQLEQQQTRLEEAQETLRQYAGELDTLRRQRNEASWYLGEERAKTSTLEAQLVELGQQLRHHEAELQRWEQAASTLRKQWEESQWYLGEAKARIRHLETQRETLDRSVADFQQRFEDASSRERQFQEALSRLTQELNALRTYGERRAHARTQVPHAIVELHDGAAEDPFFSGTPRNLSRAGFGLETDHVFLQES